MKGPEAIDPRDDDDWEDAATVVDGHTGPDVDPSAESATPPPHPASLASDLANVHRLPAPTRDGTESTRAGALDTRSFRPRPVEADAAEVPPAWQPVEDDAAEAPPAWQPVEDDAAEVPPARKPVGDDAGDVPPAWQPVEDDAGDVPPAWQPVEDDAGDVPPAWQPVEDDAAEVPPAWQPVEDDAGEVPPAWQPVEDDAGEGPPMQARSPYPSPSRGPAARSVPTEGFTLPARRRPVFRKLKKLGYATLAIVLCALLPFPRWVIEPCNILPIERNELRSRMDGIIARVSVREGQQVSKGDELVRLDDREISAELEKARAEVERLEARLAKLEAGSRPEEIRRSRARVRGLRRELSFARKEAQRKARLFRDGVTSEEALDAAEQRATVKRHELAKERAELDLLLAGVRPEEIAIARAELRKAEAQVGYLQQLWDDTRIVAPTEGLVITPKIEERENQRVLRGETVVELWQPERVEVEILVPEREIDVVEIGQPATIKVMSHPLQPFQGEVEFIAPAVERVNGESIVRVTVTADNPEQLLREGMSGYGRISTGWTNVLWIFVRRVVRWIRVRFLV